jgi:hypothetical protein
MNFKSSKATLFALLRGSVLEPLRSPLFVCLIASGVFSAEAIVIRHDVDDKEYTAIIDDFEPLATLYEIGVHGTLIDPNWVVTAAHAAFCMEPGDKIKVGHQWAEIESRFGHADYTMDDENDIALLKLVAPVVGIRPAEIYRQSNETGQDIWFIGSGGTGNGKEGQTVTYVQNKGALRKAQNKVEDVNKREIFFTFDEAEDALPLEGVSGNADSGGPAYKEIGGKYYLFGISSRASSYFKGIGEYGVEEAYSRISYHANWIDNVMSGNADFIKNHTTKDRFAQDNIKDNLPKVCEKIGFK